MDIFTSDTVDVGTPTPSIEPVKEGAIDESQDLDMVQLRLPTSLLDDLCNLSSLKRVTMQDIIREALSEHLEEERSKLTNMTA